MDFAVVLENYILKTSSPQSICTLSHNVIASTAIVIITVIDHTDLLSAFAILH
jgi:hypothetical protein